MKERMILKFRERFIIELEIKEVETINFETLEKEAMDAISITGEIQAKNIRSDEKQCGGDIKEYILNGKHKLNTLQRKNILRICALWNRYNLNDSKVGTKKQIEFLKEHGMYDKVEYEKRIQFLKDNDLHIDRGIKYGSVWMCEKIPTEIIRELKDLFQLTPTGK